MTYRKSTFNFQVTLVVLTVSFNNNNNTIGSNFPWIWFRDYDCVHGTINRNLKPLGVAEERKFKS